jgi:PEP-CTERM motif
MKKLLLLSCCLFLGLGSGWAGVTGTTNPALFNDWVDWCQFGCAGAQLATPQNFVSGGGQTGEVGLVGTFQGFYNLQQGNGWGGNFPAGMGLVYNGAAFGNTPTQIATTFDAAVTGAGAWIQNNYLSDTYTASIQLFDSSLQSLGVYSVTVNPFTAVFIGAFGSSPVWAAQFDIFDANGPLSEDFAMGSLGLSNGAPVPEPGSLLLLGSSALGLAGVLRRRFKGVL